MAGTKGRSGRPATTTHREIADTAIALFHTKGYAQTSVADIASAAGIARRTFFSYFASKADTFWWHDEEDLRRVERELAETPTDATHPLEQLVKISLTNIQYQYEREAVRRRIALIEGNAELQIGALRFQRRWADVIAAHLRTQIGATKSDMLPEVITASLLAITNTVMARWAESETDDDLLEIFWENLGVLRSAFEETVSDQILR